MKTNYYRKRADAFRFKDETIRNREAWGFSSASFGAEFQADTSNVEALARAFLEMVAKTKSEANEHNSARRTAAPPRCPAGEDRTCAPAIRPSIYDPERDLMLAQKFEQRDFHDRFEAGDCVELYFGASDGTRRTGQYFGIPNFKLGSASKGNLIQRFAQHNTEFFASCWVCGGETVQDNDFNWFPSYIPPVAPISAKSPIFATPRTLVVTLPHDLTPLQFEDKLRHKLRHCALEQWLTTPAALAHCRYVGADPAVGKRYTPYSFGMATKMTAAEEVYTLTPAAAAQSLIGIAELIILEHLALVPRRR